MRRLIIGIIAAFTIGLTGCTSTVTGQSLAAAPQASDFAVDITVNSYYCYHPYSTEGCLYRYDVSVRWLPATPLPSGMTTVTYQVNGSSGDVEFAGTFGAEAQMYTNPVRRLTVAHEGTNLTGTVSKVAVNS